MKVKLLKRLRKRFQLHERNGKYRAFDNRIRRGGIYNQTEWGDFHEVNERRRYWILREANKHHAPKNIM